MKKNLQIEGLRGICILMVVVFHVFCRFPQVYLSQNIPILQHWGEFGVTIFLLISSYYLFPKRLKLNVIGGAGGKTIFSKKYTVN